MLELALDIFFTVLSTYLIVGAILLIPIHVQGLMRIDPACANTGLSFRLLLSPGLMTFWPLLLLRWRRASKSNETAGALESPLGPIALQKWHTILAMCLVVLGPTVMALTLSHRGTSSIYTRIPEEIMPGRPWVAKIAAFGPIFPSTTAKVYFGRNRARESGLIFKCPQGTTTAPAALYWTQSLNTGSGLPADAVFLGIVAGPHRSWIPLPQKKMYTSGSWICFSFLTNSAEVFQVPE